MLESQKQLGGASYPPSLERLAELTGETPSATIKALKTEGAKARVLLSHTAGGKKKPAPAVTLVLLAEDLEAIARSDRLLELQLQSARTADVPAVDLAKLPKGLLPALSRAFKAALEQRIADRRLPRTIGVLTGKKPLFFFLADAVLPAAGAPARSAAIMPDGAARPVASGGVGEARRDATPDGAGRARHTAPDGASEAPRDASLDGADGAAAEGASEAPRDASLDGAGSAATEGARDLAPAVASKAPPDSSSSAASGAAAPAPAAPFAERFDAAFSALDRASGGHNYVTLRALREALSDVPRAVFDAELAALRRQRRYSLDPSDGRHHQMADAERDAGIIEAGNLLVYVARRHDA